MVTFLFDISLKRKLLIISSEERTEFAEECKLWQDKLSNMRGEMLNVTVVTSEYILLLDWGPNIAV